VPSRRTQSRLRNEPNLTLCFQQKLKTKANSNRRRRSLPPPPSPASGALVPPHADETYIGDKPRVARILLKTCINGQLID